MPTVVLNREIARRYTDGETTLTVDGETIRALINALDARYPGLGAVLRDDMAVAIDSLIYQDAEHERVKPESEVCFLPAIEGG